MLKDKVIIITGAGSGIGRTAAETFAKSGARVIAADLNEAAADATVELIRNSGGEAEARRCNVTDEDDVAAMVAFAVKRFGHINGAVNNAGIEMSNKPVHEMTGKEWRNVIDVDLTGVFYCVKHEVLAMKATGGGSIVNTASSSGIRATMCSSDYTAAKHGVIGLTKAAAIDAAPFGIRVNAICPGLTLTEMTRDRLMNDPTFSVALEGIRQRHIIGRFGETTEIANAMMWLLSDYSSFSTGSSMLVDGGFSI
ncbi:MAG: SDR family oxidoreductase [Rhodocyclaceae bacterium]|nr:SDR family oxidoreductase [Rhodocyclaceae bacterium]